MVGRNLIQSPSLEHHVDQVHKDRDLPGGIARASSQTAQENIQFELGQGHNSIRTGHHQILILWLALQFDLGHKDRSSRFVIGQGNNQTELVLEHKSLRYCLSHVLVVPAVDHVRLLAHY